MNPLVLREIRRLFVLVAMALICGSAFAQGTPQPPDALSALRADVQRRADRQIYPIAGMKPSDVREVLANLKSVDGDEWAAAWTAMGDRYFALAEEQSRSGNADKAALRENLRQAWLHDMFGAWPLQDTAGKQTAYRKSVDVFRRYGAAFDPPMEWVRIPFEGTTINAYLQLPKGAAKTPVVISLGGLDEYKEYVAENFNPSLIAAKLGVLALDMPGTGESPVKIDLRAERTISTAIDYLRARNDVDSAKIAIQGISAGGYWSALMSYEEKDRLRAAVVWGGPTDGYFTPEWQRQSFGTQEYLFGLRDARIKVWGFDSEQAFLNGIPKFSLQARGLVSQPSTRTLLVGGEKDSQVPIADLYLPLHTGTPKSAWVNPTGGHVGRSASISDTEIFDTVVVPWLVQQLSPP